MTGATTVTTSETGSGTHTGACAEFASSRRAFLRGLGAAAGAGMMTTMAGGVFRQVAFGATGNGNVLVVLSLRGGADGLSLVVPHGDRDYYTARPRIGVPSAALICKDAKFGLHPALAPLAPMWHGGRLAAVHAVGLPAPNRSHFAALEAVEDADPGSDTRRGWLNRLVGLDADVSTMEAAHIGSPIVPASLYGSAPALAVRKLDDVWLAGAQVGDGPARRRSSLNAVWNGVDTRLARGARSAISTVDAFAPVRNEPSGARNGAVYPQGPFGEALADTARLIRAGVGTQMVTVDCGEWDMHTALGTLEWGSMLTRVAELARGMAAFFTDLGTLGSRVTVVTISEFGRRVAENANFGLDHGYANVMLLAGAGVRGGQVYGQWPGLSRADLVDGDLAVTRDYRSVLSEVLRSRFNANISKVFPGFQPEPIGAMR